MATNNAINNLLFANVTSVNTGTVLTAAAYGTEVVCTGASSYTLTLPTVTSNANKFIDIFSQTTSNALITITPASGTIAGQSTLVIGTGDGIRIMNDGTNWWIQSQWLQPVNFSATLSTNQSIASSTVTKITYDGTLFNIGNFFDTATNNRFTPLLPGKYNFTQNIQFVTSATAAYGIYNKIHKNGVEVQRIVFTTSVASQTYSCCTTTILNMNGSTDYVEGYVNQTSGSNLDLSSSASHTTSLIGYRISLF